MIINMIWSIDNFGKNDLELIDNSWLNILEKMTLDNNPWLLIHNNDFRYNDLYNNFSCDIVDNKFE